MSMEISRKLPKYSKEEENRTIQSERDDADINKIVSRMLKTGFVPEFRGEPFFGDVSEFGDLAECKRKVFEGEQLFMSFPAELRERFNNDAGQLIAFLNDGENRQEAEELGLIQKAPPPVVVPPAPAPAEPTPELPPDRA